MQPDLLIIKNFKSIEHIELDFTTLKGKPVIVKGLNKDEEGADSNRTGKTNFIKSIVWCLYGVSQIDDINSEIIRYGQKEAFVYMKFGEKEIERKLNGKLQTFSYKKAGQQVGKESNKEAEEKFFQDMGMTNKSIISNGIYLNDTNTLLYSKPADRLKILTDWFNLSKYDTSINKTRERLKELRYEELKTKESIDSFVKEDETILDKKIEEIKTNEAKLKTKLIELRKQQDNFNNQQALERELSALEQGNKIAEESNERVKKAKEFVSGFDTNILKEVDKLKNEIEELDTELRKIKTESANTKSQLSKSYVCPNCSSPLMLHGEELIKFDKERLEVREKELSTNIDKIEKQLGEKTESYNEILKKVSEYRIKKEESEKPVIVVDKKRIEELKSVLKEALEDKSRDISDIELVISSNIAERTKLSERINNYREKKLRYNENKQRLKEIEKEEALCVLWAGERQKPGMFHDLKSLILSESVKNLEAMTNISLQNDFSIDSKIKIEIKNGIHISQGEEHPLSSMTGGEKSRISFAMALGLHKLYSTNLDLLLIDEFASAMDQTGMSFLMKVLEKTGLTSLIISHVPVESDNYIELEKSNGITKLKAFN